MKIFMQGKTMDHLPSVTKNANAEKYKYMLRNGEIIITKFPK